MQKITLTQSVAVSMIAAGINLSEQFNGADVVIVGDAAEVTAPTVSAPKKDGRNKAARKHNFEARIARREDTTRKGGAGMTKAEKSELYAALVAKHGGRPTTAQWNAACKKARKA